MSKHAKKICIIGHFGKGETLLNGQTIKTKIISKELIKVFGKKNISTIDSHGGIRTLLASPGQCWNAVKNCQNVIIMPAENGLRVYTPILLLMNIVFGRKLHYVVIGGWLPKFLKNKKFLSFCLKRFDHIYVETKQMKIMLEKAKFKNVLVMPNCKDLEIIKESELQNDMKEPYKLCTFSRVMKEKGIEDAVAVVKKINKEYGKVLYSLDIYGQVDDNYVEKFNEIKKQFPNYIRYVGEVPYNQTAHVLKKYDILLFPTRFYTEGIPGTIIDAYASGLPVIASRWESFSDLIIEERTGWGFSFGDIIDLKKRLEDIRKQFECDPYGWKQVRLNCLEQAKNYVPKNAMHILIEQLDI